MKNKLPFLLVASLLIFSLLSCNSSDLNLAEKLGKSYDYDGKEIEVSGELSLGDYIFGIGDTVNASLRVTSKLNNTNIQFISGIRLAYGKGQKNAVFINLPDSVRKYSMKDVLVFDNEGKEIPYKSVKIKGIVHYTHKGPKEEHKSKFNINKPDVFKDKEKKNDDNNDYSYEVTNVQLQKG